MKSSIYIPSKKYLSDAKRLIFNSLKQPQIYKDYYHINDIITDDNPLLQNLIFAETGQKKFKISAGTSDCVAYKAYVKQIIQDFRRNSYYRSYNNPPGNNEARQAIAEAENSKFTNKPVYTYRDICLTEGSTGAISEIFEYIKRVYPNSEVIIGTPTYYLYKYLAKFFSLNYQEATGIESKPDNIVLFNAIPDIFKKINSKTKLIVLVQPNNPTNTIYNYQEIKKLLLECKKRNILLLADELFTDLIYSDKNFINTDLLAEKVETLNNLVVVKGFSKSKNLAGLRIGYLFSKNKNLIEAVDQISEQRQCFSGASNYAGLIALDSFVQTIKNNQKQKETLSLIISKTKNNFEKFSPTIAGYKNYELTKIYLDYVNYLTKIKQYYSRYYDQCIEMLKNNIEANVPKIVAFNSIIKIKDLEKVNYFDFCLNYYLCCNTVTQIGPCFAFNQARWQNEPRLGFWLRLSYSREDKKRYLKALGQFNEFKQKYLDNPKKFLKTDLTF